MQSLNLSINTRSSTFWYIEAFDHTTQFKLLVFFKPSIDLKKQKNKAITRTWIDSMIHRWNGRNPTMKLYTYEQWEVKYNILKSEGVEKNIESFLQKLWADTEGVEIRKNTKTKPLSRGGDMPMPEAMIAMMQQSPNKIQEILANATWKWKQYRKFSGD